MIADMLGSFFLSLSARVYSHEARRWAENKVKKTVAALWMTIWVSIVSYIALLDVAACFAGGSDGYYMKEFFLRGALVVGLPHTADFFRRIFLPAEGSLAVIHGSAKGNQDIIAGLPEEVIEFGKKIASVFAGEIAITALVFWWPFYLAADVIIPLDV